VVPSRSPQDAAIRHVGPAAQDFHIAFGLGDNNRTITTLDPDRISLKAIQALHARSDPLQEQTTRLQEENAALRAERARLREAVEQWERRRAGRNDREGRMPGSGTRSTRLLEFHN
jgi:hypothetical protein